MAAGPRAPTSPFQEGRTGDPLSLQSLTQVPAAGTEILNGQFSAWVLFLFQQHLTQMNPSPKKCITTQPLRFPPHSRMLLTHLLSIFWTVTYSALITQLIGSFLRKKPTGGKSPIEKDAHCHSSYKNKHFGSKFSVQHKWNGAENCGNAHLMEYYAASHSKSYTICLGERENEECLGGGERERG